MSHYCFQKFPPENSCDKLIYLDVIPVLKILYLGVRLLRYPYYVSLILNHILHLTLQKRLWATEL